MSATPTAAFKKAIELDPSDPLPRLGLGLARFSTADLAEGSRELETAVSLDPGQSVVRSYLGKAYFEQKRIAAGRPRRRRREAGGPERPSLPPLRRHLQADDDNPPLEALESVNKAIQLNHNPVASGSRLLLDLSRRASG